MEPARARKIATWIAALAGGTAIDVAVFDEADRLPERWKPCAHAPPRFDAPIFPTLLAAVGVMAGCALLGLALRRKTAREAAAVGIGAGAVAAGASALAQGLAYHWKPAGLGVALAFALEFFALGAAYGVLAYVVARRDGARAVGAAGIWTISAGAAGGLLATDAPSVCACVAAIGVGVALVSRTRRVPVALGAAATLAVALLVVRIVVLRLAAPDTLAVESFRIMSLVSDDTHLYFTDEQGRGVLRVAKSGGAPELVVTTENRSSVIAVDDRALYWTTLDGEVLSVAKSGGAPRVVAALHALLGNLTVDAAHVYVIRHLDEHRGELVRIAKDGSDARAIGPVPGCTNLMMEDGYVYEFGGECTAVFRLDKRGGPLRAVVVHEPDIVAGVATTDRDLYFTAWGDGVHAALVRMPKSGGSPEVVLDDLASPRGVTVEGASVFWTENGYHRTESGEVCWCGRVMSLGAAGTRMLNREQPAGPLVADAENVYWVSYDDAGGKSSIRRAKR